MCGNIMWSYDRYGEGHSIWLNVTSITSLLHENTKCNDFGRVCQLRTVLQDRQGHSSFLGRYPLLFEVNKCWYHFRLTWRYSPENDLYRLSFHSTEKKSKYSKLAFWHHRNKSLKYLMKIKSYWTSWYQNITANETTISIVLSLSGEEQA